MFNRLFRSKAKQVDLLATNLDPQRPYFSGLLVRYDEAQAEAVAFFRRVNPNFNPPLIPRDATESEKVAIAAVGLSVGVAFEAMYAHKKLMIDTEQASMREGAIAVSYALFLFLLFSGQLKLNGVILDWKPVAQTFARQFLYLDASKQKQLAREGLDHFKHLVGSDRQEVKEWLELLTKTVEIWLFSATSQKRTKEADASLRQVFTFQLKALYGDFE